MVKSKFNLDNYMISLSKDSPVFINKELYEQLKKDLLIDSFSVNKTIFYSFATEIKSGNTQIIPIEKLTDDNVIYNLNNKRIILGDKNYNYSQFEIAVDRNMPIIYDWVIGSSKNKKRQYKKIIDKDLIISGLCYINGAFEIIEDRIISQNLKKCTLELEHLGEVFIVWGSYNRYQRILLENIKFDYEKLIMLDRYILEGLPIDLVDYADLITLKVNIDSPYFKIPKEVMAPYLEKLYFKGKQYKL
jgi:hypothetical protein